MSPVSKPAPKGADGRPVAQNRRARHDYDILETYEAGIVLAGSEVKSLREGKAQIRESYARVVDGEVWLYGMHVPPYTFASGFGATDPDRRRKLLLHHRQIDELARRTTQDSLTLVPLSVYFKDGRAKVDLALARGRKRYDKRHAIAARDADMEARRRVRIQAAYPGGMNDTIRLGRLAGVRVGLNWSLLAMVALIAGGLADNRFAFDAPGYSGTAYALAGALTAVMLLFGVLLHELGHAVVASRFGMRVDGITLSWMGGVTRIEGDARSPGAELGIAGVGPLVSIAFGGVLWLIRILVVAGGGGRLVVSALGWLAVINVVLAVFNLLPASPLDGGRVLHSAVWAATHDRWRATRIAATAGVWLGTAMVAAGFLVLLRGTDPLNGFFISVVGWWLLGSARAERQLGRVRQSLDGVRVGEIMRPVGAAPGWITVRAFADKYASGRPGWVWLLERWDGGGYGGVLLGDSVGAVPFPQWDLVRPQDVALPISATTGAAPDEDALEVVSRTGPNQVILVVEDGRTVGAVLRADLEALVRVGRRGPVPSTGWTLTRP